MPPSCFRSLTRHPADLHRATSTSPQPDEDSYSLDEATSISGGDMEDPIYEHSDWDIAEAGDKSDEDSSEDSDGGGVPLF